MREYVCEGIVMGTSPVGADDRIVRLFTKELGLIEARAVGAQRFLSKFTPHLGVLNTVVARLVRKRSFTLTDAVASGRNTVRIDPRRYAFALDLFFLVSALLPLNVPEVPLWYFLKGALRNGRLRIREALTFLGYDPLLARCEGCGAHHPALFAPRTHAFVCRRCSGKFKENELVLL